MLAYHNDPTVKTAIIVQLEAHRAADQLIKGQYWEDGKGCAVGCTVHSSNHKAYERRFGIPEVLARLEDRIFEGLPNDRAMEWPVRFMSAIKPGADLSMVWPKFALWLLTEEVKTNRPQAAEAIARVADLYRAWVAGKKPAKAKWHAAADAANAADAAAYAAYAAAANAAANAAAAARKKNQQETADICRKYLKI